MTYRSLTPTPANIPTSPETARSYARITRPILTLSGPRAKTEAEIARAAAREASPPDFTAKPASQTSQTSQTAQTAQTARMPLTAETRQANTRYRPAPVFVTRAGALNWLKPQ